MKSEEQGSTWAIEIVSDANPGASILAAAQFADLAYCIAEEYPVVDFNRKNGQGQTVHIVNFTTKKNLWGKTPDEIQAVINGYVGTTVKRTHVGTVRDYGERLKDEIPKGVDILPVYHTKDAFGENVPIYKTVHDVFLDPQYRDKDVMVMDAFSATFFDNNDPLLALVMAFADPERDIKIGNNSREEMATADVIVLKDQDFLISQELVMDIWGIKGKKNRTKANQKARQLPCFRISEQDNKSPVWNKQTFMAVFRDGEDNVEEEVALGDGANPYKVSYDYLFSQYEDEMEITPLHRAMMKFAHFDG